MSLPSYIIVEHQVIQFYWAYIKCDKHCTMSEVYMVKKYMFLHSHKLQIYRDEGGTDVKI